MTRTLHCTLGAVLLALVCVGCDSADEDALSIGGFYTGTYDDPNDDNDPVQFDITIPTTESGAFTFTAVRKELGFVEGEPSFDTPFAGSGTYAHPVIEWTFSGTDGGGSFELSSTVDDSRDAITLTEEGSAGPFVVRRD